MMLENGWICSAENFPARGDVLDDTQLRYAVLLLPPCPGLVQRIRSGYAVVCGWLWLIYTFIAVICTITIEWSLRAIYYIMMSTSCDVIWKLVCHFSSVLECDENPDYVSFQTEVSLGKHYVDKGIQCLVQRSEVNRRPSGGQGLPAPRLLPSQQTKLPLSLLSALP